MEIPDTPECFDTIIGPASGLEELPAPDDSGRHAVVQDQESQDSALGTAADVQSCSDRRTKKTKMNPPDDSQPPGRKYGLRRKRLPPARFMSVTSRSSFSTGGGDVEQMPID